MKKQKLIFKQLFEKETSTYTYLIGDPETKEGIIIDPTIENIERDLLVIEELGLKLKYIFDTHVHADHITGAGELRIKTGAQIVLNEDNKILCNNINLKDGEELFFGKIKITGIKTPGHTEGCMSFHIEDMIFTGDSLLYRGTGRTDFQQGNSRKLFNSIREKIFSLPDETLIYPGHDYNGHMVSSIGEEKTFNPRVNLKKTEKEFVEIMKGLNLAPPKNIDKAVPANLSCGEVK